MKKFLIITAITAFISACSCSDQTTDKQVFYPQDKIPNYDPNFVGNNQQATIKQEAQPQQPTVIQQSPPVVVQQPASGDSSIMPFIGGMMMGHMLNSNNGYNYQPSNNYYNTPQRNTATVVRRQSNYNKYSKPKTYLPSNSYKPSSYKPSSFSNTRSSSFSSSRSFSSGSSFRR